MTDRFDTPYELYQARGYSAKQTFATVFGGVIAIGLVGLSAFVVVKFISALEVEAIRAYAMTFFGIILMLISVAGSLGIVTVFRYIQKPGIQMPGILGELERKLEERK